MSGTIKGLFSFAAMLIFLSGCSTPPPPEPLSPPVLRPSLSPSVSTSKFKLQRTTFGALKGWKQDSQAAALGAFIKSCEIFNRYPGIKKLETGEIDVYAGQIQGPCRHRPLLSQTHANDEARVFFETWFVPYLVTYDGKSQGLFTGYYESSVRGSRQYSKTFSAPVLGVPSDLVKGDPYHTRSQIDQGAAKGRARVLLWMDPVDLFFLQIQGSGRVTLPDGAVVRLGYAGNNGHEFVSIGQEMMKEGLRPQDGYTMPAVRAWLKENPKKAKELMARNPRYIFFAVNDSAVGGPVGAQGVALTAERSLAVDKAYIPYGLPLWLETQHPVGGGLNRLVVAQDTGAAIKGPLRGDYFWGYGEMALKQAGRMKMPGRYFILLPKDVTF